MLRIDGVPCLMPVPQNADTVCSCVSRVCAAKAAHRLCSVFHADALRGQRQCVHATCTSTEFLFAVRCKVNG
eukprot:523367-Pelagomonas_calceolata.AAC.7